VSIGIAGGCKDRGTLNSGLETLFAEGQALEFWHAVFLCDALLFSLASLVDGKKRMYTYVDDCVFEHNNSYAVDVDCALHCSLSLWICAIFQLPTLAAFVKLETRIVVAFV
jgi:hypothetical protein